MTAGLLLTAAMALTAEPVAAEPSPALSLVRVKASRIDYLESDVEFPMELYEGRFRIIQHFAGPRISGTITMRLLGHHLPYRDVDYYVAIQPVESDFYVARWWTNRIPQRICIPPDLIAFMRLEARFTLPPRGYLPEHWRCRRT